MVNILTLKDNAVTFELLYYTYHLLRTTFVPITNTNLNLNFLLLNKLKLIPRKLSRQLTPPNQLHPQEFDAQTNLRRDSIAFEANDAFDVACSFNF